MGKARVGGIGNGRGAIRWGVRNEGSMGLRCLEARAFGGGAVRSYAEGG